VCVGLRKSRPVRQ